MTIYKLKTPISEEEIRKLNVNDVLYTSGTVVTARDQAHKRALEHFQKGKPSSSWFLENKKRCK